MNRIGIVCQAEKIIVNMCNQKKEKKFKPIDEDIYHDLLQKHLWKQHSRVDIKKPGQSFLRTQQLYNGSFKEE